jgi:hypothetical protein
MFDVHFLVNPSYETTPKWHGFLMIKLAAFQASGWAHMKLHESNVIFVKFHTLL